MKKENMKTKLIFESAYVRKVELQDANSGYNLVHLRCGMVDIVMPLRDLQLDTERVDMIKLQERRFTVTIEEGG